MVRFCQPYGAYGARKRSRQLVMKQIPVLIDCALCYSFREKATENLKFDSLMALQLNGKELSAWIPEPNDIQLSPINLSIISPSGWFLIIF